MKWLISVCLALIAVAFALGGNWILFILIGVAALCWAPNTKGGAG